MGDTSETNIKVLPLELFLGVVMPIQKNHMHDMAGTVTYNCINVHYLFNIVYNVIYPTLAARGGYM